MTKDQDGTTLFRKLNRLFKNSNQLRRKVKSKDTALVVPDKTKSSGVLLFQKSTTPSYATITSNAYNLSERLMRYQDFSEMEYTPELACVTIDSIISTPAGDFSIEDLLIMQETANDINFSFPVYCYDENIGKLTIGNAHSVRKTKTAKILGIELDSGEIIKCTYDHLFLTRKGEWIEAQNLKTNDSLMPFYRQYEKNKKGYQSVYSINDGWKLEHRFVAEEYLLNRKLKKYPEEIVHHIDLNKCNNSPINLLVCSAQEHNDIHGREWSGHTERTLEIAQKISNSMKGNVPSNKGTKGLWNQTPEAIQKISKSISKLFEDPEYKIKTMAGLISWCQSDEGKQHQSQLTSARNVERWANDVEYREKMIEIFSQHAKKQHSTPGWTKDVFLKRRDEVFASYDEQTRKEKFSRPKEQHGCFKQEVPTAFLLQEGLKYNTIKEFIIGWETDLFKTEATKRQFILRRLYASGFNSWKEYKTRYVSTNHKIIAVHYYEQEEDVYDLTVDNYHNFACNGVIIHNSALDIYSSEICSTDANGRTVHIYSENEKIKDVLSDLFYNILNIEFNLSSWTRNLPIRKDVCIPLLDGRNITIEQLSQEFQEGKENWVYSIQDTTNKLVPGKVNWCGLTRKNSELIRVWLDNDSYVDTTPDHLWILRDGQRKRADELVEGESLMPFYRKISEKGDSIVGYEKIYNPSTETYDFTHRLIAKDLTNMLVQRDTLREVVHHIDFNKKNNNPTNLRHMGFKEHGLLHSQNTIFFAEYNKSALHKEHDKIRSQKVSLKWKDPEKHKQWSLALAFVFDAECLNFVINHIKDKEQYVITKDMRHFLQNDKKFIKIFNQKNKHLTRDKKTAFITDTSFSNLFRNLGYKSYNDFVKKVLPDFSSKKHTVIDDFCLEKILQPVKSLKKYIAINKVINVLKLDKEFINHFRKINKSCPREKSFNAFIYDNILNESIKNKTNMTYLELLPKVCPEVLNDWRFKAAVKKSNSFKQRAVYRNHKIKRIERLDIVDDVYCMEVLGSNGEHDRHNFAVLGQDQEGNLVNSGIILNNCKYGDTFMYTDVSPEYGIMNVFPIPVNEIEREENYDRDDPFAVRFRWVSLANRVLEAWEVAHFRLLSNDAFLPYGSSILEPARRIWRQLILAEDAMLVYRVVRSPDRRVFSIDVGNLPAAEVEGYMEQQKRNLRSNQIADSTTNRVDLRYNALPVHCDTPIPLLDGRTISIKDLAKEFDEGKENWVYSINDQSHNIVPGKVKWCGKNYTATKLTKVWLDNDSYVLTAPEHPFILRCGATKRADELVENDSLMPFYRKINNKGYEECYTPDVGQYIKTHQFVAKNCYPYEWETVKTRTTHHNKPWEQNNKLNNLPSNLTVMSIWEHRAWHIKNLEYTLLTPENIEMSRQRLIKWNKSDKKKQRVSCLNKQRNSVAAMADYNGSDLHKQHNEIRRQAQINSWNNKETKKIRSEKMRWIVPEECVEITKQIFLSNEKISRDNLFQLVLKNQQIINLITEANKQNKRKISKFSIGAFYQYMLQGLTYSEFKKQIKSLNVEYKNHKVARIEHLEVAGEDVFCMTVLGPNGEQDRHNFAVCGLKPSTDGLTNIVQVDGIIIKNSTEEDYFIAVRGNDSGTKIDTLPGGANATAVDDVKYLQQKMISALKIPASYLGYTDNMSSKSSLAQLDVRFSRTISMIQKVIVSELNKLAIIHLFAHGFSSDDLINFSIKLTNPSSIAEQQKLQLWRDRFEIADSAPKGLLSNRWISKNILTLTDYDIREIQREQAQEGGASDEESSGGSGFGGGNSSSSSFADSIFGDNEEEETSTEENPAEVTPGKDGEEEIKAGAEPLEDDKEDDVDLILSSDDNLQNTKFPLKPTSRANQTSKHRQYVKHAKSGHADIGMSTNNEIIKAFDSSDVFDSDFFRDTTKNTLIKTENDVSNTKHRTTIARSPDMIALFEKMKQNGFGKQKNNSSNLLSEDIEIEIDVQDEINNTTTNVIFEGVNIVDDFDGSDLK